MSHRMTFPGLLISSDHFRYTTVRMHRASRQWSLEVKPVKSHYLLDKLVQHSINSLRTKLDAMNVFALDLLAFPVHADRNCAVPLCTS